MLDHQENYLESVLFEFRRYKTLGDKTFAQLEEKDMHWIFSESDNSIAVIVKHMTGNMLSRWTNFLTEDGEKTWRDRETEFIAPLESRWEIIQAWENGWQCLFDALDTLNSENFETTQLKIRNQPHTIFEAVNRQLAHYANHVGQIVYIGKMIKGAEWVSLSISKGGSQEYNQSMFKN